MAELPTYQSRGSVDTGETGPQAKNPPPNAALLVGQSLGDIAGGLSGIAQAKMHVDELTRRQKMHVDELTRRQNNVINDLAEQKTRQVEALEVNQKTSQLRTDWNKQLIEYQQNPTPDLHDKATQEYDDYVEKMLSTARTDNIRNELSLNAAEYRLEFSNKTFMLGSQQQLAQFGATFDQMMSNAEDSLFATKDLTELAAQKKIMNNTIDSAVQTGQIRDPQTIQNLRDKVSLLSVSWAEATMASNPDLVEKVINGQTPKGLYSESTPDVFQGVDAKQRQILLDKIKTVRTTENSQLRLQLRESLESDKKQIVQTGSGAATNMQLYKQVFGDEYAKSAQRELNNAQVLHGYVERAKGASGAELTQMLVDAEPKGDPNDPTYGDKADIYEDVQKLVHSARSDKKNDAFTYFATNPTVKPLAQKVLDSPTPENQAALRNAVVNLQKQDPSMSPGDIAVMPKSEALNFIDKFNSMVEVGNKTDGAGVINLLNSFASTYGDMHQMAFNQLNNLPGGTKITNKINPLLWHSNNPSTFRLILDSIRKDSQEQMSKFETGKIRQNFLTDVNTDPNLMNYRSSMSANNGANAANLVDGVHQTFRDFARDYVLNGGTTKDASSLFFAPYSFGTKNGVSYARPRGYKDKLGNEHVMSDEQIRLSNNFLDWYPRTIDPSTIAPESAVNQTQFFTTEQLTKDVRDALRENTFWSTTEDETGVYMYVKGAITGAPRQVFYKNGNPVRMNFVDTMTGIPKLDYGQKPYLRGTPRTDDTFWDHVAQAFSTD